MRIIGITGTLGAGKGTIVDFLVKTKGFSHFSVRNYLTQIINERGLPVNRDSFVEVANELRSTHSSSFLAEQLFEEARLSGNDCVIESLRTPGEVKSLKAKGNFTLFGVDADQKLRYSRVIERASETDHVSFETFASNEAREMTSTDPDKQNISACMKMADYTFENNGSFNELYRQLEETLNKLNDEKR